MFLVEIASSFSMRIILILVKLPPRTMQPVEKQTFTSNKIEH